MSNRPYTRFPWLHYLWDSLFWSFIALFGIELLLVFVLRWAESAEGTSAISILLNPIIWLTAFITALTYMLLASITLIPSFYAGMFACVAIEKRGAQYQEQFATTFRTAATLTFIVALAIVLLVFYAMGRLSSAESFGLIGLIIAYYFFDDNVAETVWPDIFLIRQDPEIHQNFQ